VPDLLPVLVENQPQLRGSGHPGATPELTLELARRPARVAECNQALLRAVVVGDVPHDFAARGHRHAPVDSDGFRSMIVGAVNDEAYFGLDRTTGKDACLARDCRVLLAQHLQKTSQGTLLD